MTSNLERKNKDLSFWSLFSLMGLILFVLMLIIESPRESMFGLIIMILPLSVFHFNLFAGRIFMLKVDVKAFWFYAFNIGFIMIDMVIVSSIGFILSGEPVDYSNFSMSMIFSIFWPYSVIVYGFITISGIIYSLYKRKIKKRRG